MYYCKWCDEEFRDNKELKRHEKECDLNPSNTRNKFVCNYCHQSFSNKEALKKHINKCSYNPSLSVKIEEE